jgi:hypothetical protein
MARMSRTVRYKSSRPDDDLMPEASEAVEDVTCSSHKDTARLDSFAGGTATISGCCMPTISRAEKALLGVAK